MPMRRNAVGLAVVVAALGYFVDIFDLLLFALVRKDSLQEVLAADLVGLAPDAADALLKSWGLWLDNTLQTTGLLLGGLAWGVLADRKGRIAVLFGSILVYSVANLLNANIADINPDGNFGWMYAVGLGRAIDQYEVLRFVAGFGLAGELGAGITLVAELVSEQRRGYATTVVATVGILGAVAAYLVTLYCAWRTAFMIGGGLGIGLLFLRIGVVESGLFKEMAGASKGAGAFWRLAWPPRRLLRYTSTVLIAVPIWFAVGVLVKYADVIGASLGLTGANKPSPRNAILWCYIGLAVGDVCSGLCSQWMRSRKKAILLFQLLTVAAIALYFTLGATSLPMFYASVAFLGFATGYWAVFVTTIAEQFGTDLRGTAATSAPNLVRWSAAGWGLLWVFFEGVFAASGFGTSVAWMAAAATAAVAMLIAIPAVFGIRETYGISLDFKEP